MNATPQGTTAPATPANTVAVRHFNPAMQAALEDLAAVLFPTANIIPTTHAQPAPDHEPDCPRCDDRRFVGGTDRDGNDVDDPCPICNVGGAVVTASTTQAVA